MRSPSSCLAVIPWMVAAVLVVGLALLSGCTLPAPLLVPAQADAQRPAPTLGLTNESGQQAELQATPTRTPEPLVPTPLPKMFLAASETAIAAASEVSTGTQRLLELSPLTQNAMRSRLGVGWPRQGVPPTDELVRQLGFGWYLDWGILVTPLTVEGLEFAQIVLLRQGYSPALVEQVTAAVQANPAALWLLGNEPDVPWQDNRTPEEYAEIYHRLYVLIKSLDPSAKVGIGGVSQVTPLRLAYLERVLQAYEQRFGQPMPVDVWNVHAFILREERDSWGVSIPPGFDVEQGMLYEIEDHDDIAIFQQMIIDFRRWLAQLGQRNKPLIVSEYGILMPEGYGFPPEAVVDFMLASFDFLLNARDPEIGYPADDNRLVQRLAWFSLGDHVYPTGNLVDPASGKLTPVGQAFAQYAASLESSGAQDSPPAWPDSAKVTR